MSLSEARNPTKRRPGSDASRPQIFPPGTVPCKITLKQPPSAPIWIVPEAGKVPFNVGEGKSPFEDAGVMVNRQVWTEGVESTYKGPAVTLGELIVDEKDVPEEFFIEGPALDEWKYLKGPKSEERVTPEGFKYHYTEGGMAFPDALDKPSRTIITGEGGVSPSRFKHVILTPSGRYRRLTPVELERLNMFPDNHTEGASAGRRAFLMGNALVTGIIERIGISLLGRIE